MLRRIIKGKIPKKKSEKNYVSVSSMVQGRNVDEYRQVTFQALPKANKTYCVPKNDDLEIYVYTHTDLTPPVTDSHYTVITANPEAKIGGNLKKEIIPYIKGKSEFTHSLSECLGLYYISRKKELKKYIGFCHSRTYFNFFDKIPNIDDIFDRYDVVCGIENSFKHSSVRSIYEKSHNIEDLYLCCDIVRGLYPDYTQDEINDFLNRPFIGNRNLVIMKREDFIEWTKFWDTIITEFNRRMGFSCDSDMILYYTGKQYDNAYYLSRSNGFLVERLMTLYFKHNFKKILQIPLKITTTGYDAAKKDYCFLNGGKGKEIKNLDMYICCHKDFSFKPQNKTYKILTLPGIKITDTVLKTEYVSNPEIDDFQRAYGELSHMYYIWKKGKGKKYVGFCHYRRLFKFINEFPDLEKIFNVHDLIFTDIFKSNPYKIWKMNRYEKDILECLEIIKEKYPEYAPDIEKNYLNGEEYFPFNIFIMKWEDFDRWCQFVFGVIEEFKKLHNFSNEQDVYDYVYEHRGTYERHPNPRMRSLEVQSRLFGLLGEHLSTIFIKHNFKSIKEIPFLFLKEQNNSNNLPPEIEPEI